MARGSRHALQGIALTEVALMRGLKHGGEVVPPKVGGYFSHVRGSSGWQDLESRQGGGTICIVIGVNSLCCFWECGSEIRFCVTV